ncbi:C39 family peptidase [Candidatus Riflebacteria bacterium]
MGSLNFTGIETPSYGQPHKRCGQYALAVVLAFLEKGIEFKKIYDDTNPYGTFTAPGTITDYLQAAGLNPIQHNYGKIAELKRQIDRGRPVIALVSCYLVPHWVAVVGYLEEDEKNYWEIMDSIWGISSESRRVLIEDKSFQLLWIQPMGPWGLLSTCHNVWIEIDGERKDPLPPFVSSYGDLPAVAINNFLRGLANKEFLRILRSLFQALFSIPSVFLGGPGRILENLGNILRVFILLRPFGIIIYFLGKTIKYTGSLFAFFCILLERKIFPPKKPLVTVPPE